MSFQGLLLLFFFFLSHLFDWFISHLRKLPQNNYSCGYFCSAPLFKQTFSQTQFVDTHHTHRFGFHQACQTARFHGPDLKQMTETQKSTRVVCTAVDKDITISMFALRLLLYQASARNVSPNPTPRKFTSQVDIISGTLIFTPLRGFIRHCHSGVHFSVTLKWIIHVKKAKKKKEKKSECLMSRCWNNYVNEI